MSAKYEHRNGEAELPTEDGDYGFSGVYLVGRTAQHPEGINRILRVVGGSFDLPGTDEYFDPEHFQGRWWGPIVGPWSEE